MSDLSPGSVIFLCEASRLALLFGEFHDALKAGNLPHSALTLLEIEALAAKGIDQLPEFWRDCLIEAHASLKVLKNTLLLRGSDFFHNKPWLI